MNDYQGHGTTQIASPALAPVGCAAPWPPKWLDEQVTIVAADADARTITVILSREISGIKIGDSARLVYRQHSAQHKRPVAERPSSATPDN
jgi:hypothetical protein